ncbi:MAG: HEAT repeat domain-containing protein [Planctomycetota bacterium]
MSRLGKTVRWATSLACLALALTPGVLRAEPPVYVDVQRSIEKQRDAATVAVKDLRTGAAGVKDALNTLCDASAVVRDAVVAAIIKDWQEPDLESLVGGLGDKRALVAEGVAEILGRRKLARAIPALAAALGRDGSEDAHAILLWALSEIGGEEGSKVVEKYFGAQRKSPRLRSEALRAFARLSPARARSALESALEDKIPAARIAALDSLGAIDAVAGLDAAVKILRAPFKQGRDDGWAARVWFSACERLRRVEERAAQRDKLRDGVDALIAALANLRGRELRDSIATLEDLTGQYEHGDFIDAWSLWWQAQRENWQPTAAGKGAADKARAPAGRTAVVRYHGTPIDSQRVVFVQDISGGMGRQLDGEWKGSGPTRLDVSKQELDRVLDKLSDDAWVNLVYFGSYYYSFAKEPQPLKSERRRLKDFNAQQEIPKPQGHNRGNVYDTLAQVIQQPTVDTVYLLTEGAPTEGKYLDYDRFLDHFERLARVAKVRVHVLLMGKTGGRNRAFLQKLAELTGGELREVELAKE